MQAKALSMRVAATLDAHRLASVSHEMQQDEEEDTREEAHADLISQAPGTVQKLIAASRQVVESERQAIGKAEQSLRDFDPPDCVQVKPRHVIRANKAAWTSIISKALRKVGS